MRTLGALALVLLLTGCGGGGSEPKAEPSSAEPTISEAAACSLVEDAVGDGVAIMGKKHNSDVDASTLRDDAEVIRDAQGRLEDGDLATHLEVIADSMDDLADTLLQGGTWEGADVKASATEVGEVCGWL